MMPRTEVVTIPEIGPCARVLFTEGDERIVEAVARGRHEESIARGRKPRYGEADDQMLANGVVGCRGEFAVSTLTGLRWHYRIGNPGGCDVGGDLEVKTRSVFLGSTQARALAGSGGSAKSFRWQVWRTEIGQRLVAVLAPRWLPSDARPRGRHELDVYTTSAIVVGWLPIEADLFSGGSRHVMISAADLRPLGTLDCLIADRTLEERIAAQIRAGGSVAGALRACVRANGTLGKTRHALELAAKSPDAALRVAVRDLANALGVTL